MDWVQALLSVPEDPGIVNGTSFASSVEDEGLRAKQAGSDGSADRGGAELDANTKDMLQKLSQLSNSLVRDAKEDDEVFRAQQSESLG